MHPTIRSTLACALVALVASAPAVHAQQAKRAFTIEDLYRTHSVTDPHYSPDGRHIAFQVGGYDLAAGKSHSDIYVMKADGTGLTRMTVDHKSDSHPRWSPDGKWLLFVSNRDDGDQAWRIPVDGGEAQRLTDFSMGVNEPMWTPDGKKIVFFTEVYPECGADSDCNKKIADDVDKGPMHAHLADHLMYRHWTFWKDGKRFHILAFDIASGTYTDLTPGQIDAPYYITGGANAGFDVSPDGHEVCYSTNLDADHWETTNEDLFIVPIGGGKARDLTGDNKAYDGDPQYSPDGRYIAYRLQKIPKYESDRYRLALYDRKNGTRRVLTESFDNWVDDFVWAPDSKSIYFTGEYHGTNPLYRVDLDSDKISQVINFRTIDGVDIAPDGKHLAVARRSVGEPREIWTATTRGKSPRRLTMFNKALEDEVDIRPAKEMWFESPTGKKIETFIVTPHGFDPSKKYPLIFNVHGGPQGQWMDSFRGDWQVYPGAGYIVAFPNPHGSTGYGQEFTHEISRDWGGKVYQDLMAVADSLARLPYVDASRMGSMGWSYGGYMMMWLEGHTDRFKASAAMMGVYDLPAMWGSTEELWFPQYDLGGTPWQSDDYTKWSPNQFAAKFKTPCLVITGEHDYRVPYTQSLEFFTALQKQGVPSRLIVFENDGHWPSVVKSMPLYYNAHLEWFHKYLGGGPAPYDSREMVRNRAHLVTDGAKTGAKTE